MRRFREGDLTERRRDRILRAIDKDIRSLYVVELTIDLASRSRQLLVKHQLRAGDAIQLASSLYLKERLADDVFLVAYDQRLLTAGAHEGLKT